MKRLISTLLVSLLLGIVPAAQAEAKTFKNCTELRKVHKFGVAVSKSSVNSGAGPIFSPKVSATVYRLNRKLDADKDNIACEVLRPNSQPAPSSTPTATPTSSPVPPAAVIEPPSEPSDPVDLCRIQEASTVRGMTGAGFPEWTSMTPRSGVVKWALVPIDFTDLPGEQNFRPRVNEQMALLTEWFMNVSGGRLKVEWVVLDRWATLPGKTSDYVIPASVNVSSAANGPKLFRDAMTAADPMFDFTNIQTVNFILPTGQTFLGESSQGFPWDEVVKTYSTNEGKVAAYSVAGQFFDLPGKAYWSYWAHEFGHAIGLPHVGGGGGGGIPPFNPWDLMGGQDGPSRELSGWLRFIAGWMSDQQVYCKDSSKVANLTIPLTPLSSAAEGFKFAVLPVTKTKAILVESRRATKFSCTTTPSQDGVMVYIYDATLGHFQNFLTPVTPAGRQTMASSCRFAPQPIDTLLRDGDKVTVDGLTIEVLKMGTVDRLRITKG